MRFLTHGPASSPPTSVLRSATRAVRVLRNHHRWRGRCQSASSDGHESRRQNAASANRAAGIAGHHGPPAANTASAPANTATPTAHKAARGRERWAEKPGASPSPSELAASFAWSRAWANVGAAATTRHTPTPSPLSFDVSAWRLNSSASQSSLRCPST